MTIEKSMLKFYNFIKLYKIFENFYNYFNLNIILNNLN